MALVGIGRAASIAHGVADVTMRANWEAGEVVLSRGRRWGVVDRCEWEGSLAVAQPFGGVESGRWSRVGPRWVSCGS